ncbi:MAG: hypothetical protein AB1714_10675 [Acidobacteriota bacterium]
MMSLIGGLGGWFPNLWRMSFVNWSGGGILLRFDARASAGIQHLKSFPWIKDPPRQLPVSI